MRILYVEDDPMNRRVVKDMLSVVGASMTEACDAEAGLDQFEHGEFDLVLMDLRMPGMDGLAAIQQIRLRDDKKAAIPIIVVTADTSVDLRERCVAAGADELMLKPIAMAPLLKAITRMASPGRSKVA